MDVDSLKAELEEHLAKNPDAQAPDGFRDRFDIVAEQYKADDGEHGTKAVLEAELQQIRAEAEAAWRCCEEHAEEASPRAEAVETPVSPRDPVTTIVDEHVNPPTAGFMQRYGIALIVAVVVLGAAYYFFRR